ncbi:hypothetical protein C0J52_08391 [Blattella germanica]|nr:hypothetical protein C0J52_08391 [Blattella germanica]
MSTKMARLSETNHCQELDGDGLVCGGESKNLEILNEIKQIYEDRLRRIDDEIGDAGTELKLRTLQSWVMDLGEQNAMLVQTVEQLEREASERVALLKEGLDRSARSALNFMNKLDEEAVGQKVIPPDQNEELLHTKIRNLQSDITNLLELIRRAREENNWDITGLIFTELSFDDVFDSLQTTYGHTNCISSDSKGKDMVIDDLKAEINNLNSRLKQFNQYENSQGSEILKLQDEVITLREDNMLKDGQIQGFIKRIEDLCSDVIDGDEQEIIECRSYDGTNQTVEQSFINLDVNLSKALRQRNSLVREVQDLNQKLERRTEEMDQLSKTVNEMDKAAKDMREALTAEVADKHDRILALRREIQLLEERCHQADMQTHFKDNIIKEMRKDLKTAKAKLAALGTDQPDGQYMSSSTFSSFPSHHSSTQQEFHLTNILQQLYKRDHKEIQLAGHRSPSQMHQTNISEMTCTSTYQQNCTPEKLSRSSDEIYQSGSSDGMTQQFSQQFNNSFLEENSVPFVSDMADHLSSEETYYEVRRRNSPPSREGQVGNGNQLFRGTKSESGSNQNIATKIKQQEKTIKDLEDSLKRYENDLGDLRLKTSQTEMELEDMKMKVLQQVTGSMTESVLDFHPSSENEMKAWSEFIEQMKSLSAILKTRENKISIQDSTISDLLDKVKKSQFEIDALKGKCAIYLHDIQTAERNQADSERRITELKDVLTKSYNNVQQSLGYLASDPDIANILKSQDMKTFHERSEESQEAFKNLKAEMNYLSFYLKSREKQVKHLEGLVCSLNDVLKGTQKDLEDLKNETFTYVEELKVANSKLKKEVLVANSKIKELERKIDLSQSRELDAKAKMEALQSNLISREKVTTNQEEMIKILQDTVNMAQKEQEDLRKKLKETELEKEKLLHDLSESEKKERKIDLSQSRELDAKAKMEALQSNLISREKVTTNQEEMIKILQDTVNMAQKEQEDLRKKLKETELEKEKLLHDLSESEKKKI